MVDSQATCLSGDGASTRRPRGPRALWVAMFWVAATAGEFSLKLRFLARFRWFYYREPLADAYSFPTHLWRGGQSVGLWDLWLEFWIVLATNVSLGLLWAWIARRGYRTSNFGPGLMFLGLTAFQLGFNVFVVMSVCSL